jgi:hypothetical protein
MSLNLNLTSFKLTYPYPTLSNLTKLYPGYTPEFHSNLSWTWTQALLTNLIESLMQAKLT